MADLLTVWPLLGLWFADAEVRCLAETAVNAALVPLLAYAECQQWLAQNSRGDKDGALPFPFPLKLQIRRPLAFLVRMQHLAIQPVQVMLQHA